MNPNENLKNLNVDVKTLPQLVCPNCESIYFEPVFAFRKMSALISPTGKEAILPQQTFRCISCKLIPEEFDV